MDLLLFAHFAEAESFINSFKLKKMNHSLFSAWENEQMFLLICGESLQSSVIPCSAFLSLHHVSINEIINIGIAGALNPKLKLGGIYEIRSFYAENSANTIEFQSFHSINRSAKLDCVSSHRRIMDASSLLALAPLADIVDREAWALASVAHFFRKPFRAIKQISDFAGSNSSCIDIRENAKDYSSALCDFFLQVRNLPQQPKTSMYEASFFFADPQFHFTHSQKLQFQNLCKRLSISTSEDLYRLIGPEQYQSWLEKWDHSKMRTKALLLFLKEKLNPEYFEVKSNLEAKLKLLRNTPLFSLDVEKLIEDNRMDIKIHPETNKDIDVICQIIKKLDLEEIKNILNGENF